MPRQQFDNKNRGVLFNNIEDKREGKQDPDYRGRINVEGTEYWLAGWINTGQKSGKKYLSLKVQAQVVAQRTEGNGAAADDRDEFNDEVPF